MRRVALVLGLLAVVPASPSAHAGDWSVRRDPFDPALIARYKALLARSPHDGLALSALVSLYKRHRTIDLLVHEYEAANAKAETASSLVVLGRLARNSHDNDHALALFTRAVELDSTSYASWLAVAELRLRHGDKAESQDAFAKASAAAKTPAQHKEALRHLIDATREAGDVAAMEDAFETLAKLTPRDGKLWSERGDAEVELKQFTTALASYQRAEELLHADPERKLLAIAARALAFDRAGDPGQAISEYERAQAASPPGFYLRKDLTFRIIDVFRRHHTLNAAIEYLLRTWPGPKRKAFEWGTLAGLYKEGQQTDSMVYALHQAVKADPKDVNLQWQLIRHYDATDEHSIALSLLEVAATASPADVSLNIELAHRLWSAGSTFTDDEDRYYGFGVPRAADAHPQYDTNRRSALSIVKRLSRLANHDVDAHRALAEVYARFGMLELAISEARKVATLEPDDDNYTVLGDALFAAGRRGEAIDVWKKVGKAATPAALQKLADIYLDHEMWTEAVDAYTEAMFGDLHNAMLWRGRAIALSELGRITEARIDAQHAVELLGLAPYEPGHEVRFRLVQIMRQDAIIDAFGDQLQEPDLWLMQLDTDFFAPGGKKPKPPDLQAGYLLAEYYRRTPDEKLARVLERLHQLVPTDLGLASELIRTYRQLEKFDDAIAIAKWLAAADPTRAKEVDEMIASIERKRPVVAAREEREAEAAAYFGPPCVECRYHSDDELPATFGLRLGLGDSWRGPASGAMTVGGRLLLPVHDELALVGRVDWTRRAEPPRLMAGSETTIHAIGVSLGLAYPIVRSDHGTALVGAAYRGELRLGDPMDRIGYDRVGFAADATLEYMPHGIPASIGMRFEQGLSERAQSSTFVLELTVELTERRH